MSEKLLAPINPESNPKFTEINNAIINFVYVPPVQPIELQPTTPEVTQDSAKVMDIAVEDSNVVIGGLKNKYLHQRLKNTRSKIKDLEASGEIHKDPAKALGSLEPLPEATYKYGSPSPRTQYRSRERYGDKGFTEYASDAAPMMGHVSRTEGREPVTLSQKLQNIRAGNQQSKANAIRSGRQYRLRKVWGENIGQDSFKKDITKENIGLLEERRGLKAHKRFKKLEDKAKKYEESLRRSANGEDLIGEMVSAKIERTKAKVSKLSQKASEADTRWKERVVAKAIIARKRKIATLKRLAGRP